MDKTYHDAVVVACEYLYLCKLMGLEKPTDFLSKQLKLALVGLTKEEEGRNVRATHRLTYSKTCYSLYQRVYTAIFSERALLLCLLDSF